MSHASQFRTGRRAKFLALLPVAVFLIFGIQSQAAQAETLENHCGSPALCTWAGTFYSGSEVDMWCPTGTGVFWLGYEAKSAKNRCGGEHIYIGWYEGGVTSWKACMNPGGERPEPGRFNVFQRVASC